MCFSRSGYFGLAASVLLALDGTGSLAADAGKLLSVDEIISRAVARAQQAQAKAGQGGYTYTKLTVTEELDAAGRVKERKEKVYQVYFQAGATHLRLLTVNGRQPAQADRKTQSENDTSARQILGAKSGKTGDNRENFLTPELVARFNFTLIDQKPINGRKAYRVAFEPKRPAPPVHHIVDRLLDRISGT